MTAPKWDSREVILPFENEVNVREDLKSEQIGCLVVPLREIEVHEAGQLLGMTKTADVVDAVVVTTALRQKATILTGDQDDIEQLVRASGREVAVVAI